MKRLVKFAPLALLFPLFAGITPISEGATVQTKYFSYQKVIIDDHRYIIFIHEDARVPHTVVHDPACPCLMEEEKEELPLQEAPHREPEKPRRPLYLHMGPHRFWPGKP